MKDKRKAKNSKIRWNKLQKTESFFYRKVKCFRREYGTKKGNSNSELSGTYGLGKLPRKQVSLRKKSRK